MLIVAKMDKDKRFVRNVVLMALSVFVLGVKSFVLLAILSKGLGAHSYGVWSQVNISIVLLGTFAILALEQAVIRLLSAAKTKKRISKEFFSVFFVVSLSGILFSLILFFIAKPLSILILKDVSNHIYFQAAAILVLLYVLTSLNLNYFRAMEEIKKYSLVVVIDTILQLSLIYLALSLGYGINGVIIAMIVSFFLILLLQLFLIGSGIGFSMPNIQVIAPYIRFSAPLILSPVLYWILRTGDQYVIGYFLGATSVGIYSLVYSLSYIIRILTDPITLVLLPSISKSYNQGEKDFKKYVDYAYKYSFAIAIPAGVGLSLLAKNIISLVSNEGFISGSSLVPVLSLGLIVYTFWIISSIVLALFKRTKLIFILVLVSTFVNTTLNIVLVPLWGMFGAAIATLITFVLLASISVFFVHRHINFTTNFLFKVTLASSIMGIVVYFVKNIFGLAVSIVLGVIIYGVLLLVTKSISKSEISFILGSIIKKVK